MRYFLLFGLLLCIQACGTPEISPEKTGIPADSLISKEKMILVLADVHVIEAVLQTKRNRGKDPKDLIEPYYEKIFRKHGISKTRYDMSLRYYRKDPEQFSKMYDKVIQVISDRQKRYLFRE